MTLFGPTEIAALIVAISFAAGLNVYATLVTLGLLARFDVVALPPQLAMATDWWVIGVAGALFVVEFVADKIPAFDLVWNALQTFVRVPVAALMAWSASSSLSPEGQVVAAVGGGLIALVAHGSKFAVRGVVTPSPEPFSNIALSLVEDAAAVGLTWFATRHPFLAATLAIVMVAVAFVLARWVFRALKRLFVGAERTIEAGVSQR